MGISPKNIEYPVVPTPENTRGNVEIIYSEMEEISPVSIHNLITVRRNTISATQSAKLIVRTDKSAIVLSSIVTLFLITHSYRMALKIYEVALPNWNSIEAFKICFSQER